MKKMKLKEDEDGNKITQVKGIRAGCKIMKTRYAKPFESVQIKIPYETGMNPYSGLTDLFEAKGGRAAQNGAYVTGILDPVQHHAGPAVGTLNLD